MQNKISDMSVNRRTLTKATLASIAAMKGGHTAFAQEATPIGSDGTPAAEPDTTMLLQSLADPRFIVIDGDNLYFTESGTGGDEEIFTNDGEPISMSGHTGKLSVFNLTDGSVREIVSDFRSYTFGDHGEIVGAAGLALDGAGSAYVAVGAPGPFVGVMPLTGEEGVVYKVDLASGEKEVIADLIGWEIENDPDPMAIDSNLYGAELLDGVLYVADAGGNTIIAIDVETNEVSTFAVTGGLDAPFLGEDGNPARGGEMEIDSVPSDVAVGPDGRLYVSYVTGGPFPPGFSPVDAFSVDGSVERVVEGLTMVGAIAFNSAGQLHATVVSADFLTQGPGQIVRVEADGSFTIVADGLPVPGGLAFDADDNLYTFVFSAVAPDGGALVRIGGGSGGDDGTAEPQATPVS